MFLDLNGNLAQDSGEPSGVTDAAGHFSIALGEVSKHTHIKVVLAYTPCVADSFRNYDYDYKYYDSLEIPKKKN